MIFDIVSPQPHSEFVGTASWRAEKRSPRDDEPGDRSATEAPHVGATMHRRETAASQDDESHKAGDVAEYGIGRVRDLFLEALDAGAHDRTLAIARHLVSCANPLPSVTCVALGVPVGSSYGAGARALLERASEAG